MMKPGNFILAVLFYFSTPRKLLVSPPTHHMIDHLHRIDNEEGAKHCTAGVNTPFQDVWILNCTENEDDPDPRQEELDKLLAAQFNHFDLELAAAASSDKTTNTGTGSSATENHYLWHFYDLIVTTLLGVWLLMSAQKKYRQNWKLQCISTFSCRRRWNNNQATESSPPARFPKRSTACYSAYILASWIARFPTTFEGLYDLFCWTIGRQRQVFFNSCCIHEHCTDSHGTDDTETLLGSDLDDNDDDDDDHDDDDDFTSPITRPDTLMRTVARISNHIECYRNGTTALDNELPITGAAIEFFHTFRFNEERIK